MALMIFKNFSVFLITNMNIFGSGNVIQQIKKSGLRTITNTRVFIIVLVLVPTIVFGG